MNHFMGVAYFASESIHCMSNDRSFPIGYLPTSMSHYSHDSKGSALKITPQMNLNGNSSSIEESEREPMTATNARNYFRGFLLRDGEQLTTDTEEMMGNLDCVELEGMTCKSGNQYNTMSWIDTFRKTFSYYDKSFSAEDDSLVKNFEVLAEKIKTELSDDNQIFGPKTREWYGSEHFWPFFLYITYKTLPRESIIIDDPSWCCDLESLLLLEKVKAVIRSVKSAKDLMSLLDRISMNFGVGGLHRTSVYYQALHVEDLSETVKTFTTNEINDLIKYIIEKDVQIDISHKIVGLINLAQPNFTSFQATALIESILEKEDISEVYVSLGRFVIRCSNPPFAMLNFWIRNCLIRTIDLTECSWRNRSVLLSRMLNERYFVLSKGRELQELREFIKCDKYLADKGCNFDSTGLLYKHVNGRFWKDENKRDEVQERLIDFIISFNNKAFFEKYIHCFDERIVAKQVADAGWIKTDLSVCRLSEISTFLFDLERTLLTHGNNSDFEIIKRLITFKFYDQIGYCGARALMNILRNWLNIPEMFKFAGLFIDRVCEYEYLSMNGTLARELISYRMAVKDKVGLIDPKSAFFRLYFNCFTVEELKLYDPRVLLELLREPIFRNRISNTGGFEALKDLFLFNPEYEIYIEEFILSIHYHLRASALKDLVKDHLARLMKLKQESIRKEYKNLISTIISLPTYCSVKEYFLRCIPKISKDNDEIEESLRIHFLVNDAINRFTSEFIELRKMERSAY